MTYSGRLTDLNMNKKRVECGELRVELFSRSESDFFKGANLEWQRTIKRMQCESLTA